MIVMSELCDCIFQLMLLLADGSLMDPSRPSWLTRVFPTGKSQEGDGSAIASLDHLKDALIFTLQKGILVTTSQRFQKLNYSPKQGSDGYFNHRAVVF